MTTALLSVSGAQPLTFTMKDQAQTPQYKVPKFLRSLYSILENEDGAIVKWVQNQELKPNRVTAFHILDLERFEQEVLPKYFKHSKFASFQRQLNNFGFRKWTKTQSSGVCTFSHNCFPPDPRETGVLRASIREQWRQKNTDSRRRVGNGITKAERKLQQLVQQSVQLQQQQKDKTHSSPVKKINTLGTDSDDDVSCVGIESPSRVESFSDMLKTPLEPAYNRAPTHQPQLKKLARPMNGEWVSGSGLEAFAEAPVKSTMLPPIHTHHLPHVSYNNTINIGTYPAQPDIYQTKMELPPLMDASAAPPAPHMMMMSATQLEPWAWTPHAASAAYDMHHFPMEVAAWPHHHGQPAHHCPVVDPSLAHKGVYCQQASPSTMEEFSFDSLMLFAE